MIKILLITVVPSFESDNSDSYEDRIVGGFETTISQHPHQVSLRRRGGHICGGSIIAATKVLTAAQCLTPNAPPSLYTVLAGTSNRLAVANGQLRQVLLFRRHPLYNSVSRANDVGIVQVQAPFVFGTNVRAIPLPPQGAPIANGASVTVSGWGSVRQTAPPPFPTILRVVKVPIVPNQRCNAIYSGRITPGMLWVWVMNELYHSFAYSDVLDIFATE